MKTSKKTTRGGAAGTPHRLELTSNRGVTVPDHRIHVSEADAAKDFTGLLARVHAGAEVVIERDKLSIAVLRAPAPLRRTISECIALLPEDSSATIDDTFAKDVEAAVSSHLEPLQPPEWE